MVEDPTFAAAAVAERADRAAAHASRLWGIGEIRLLRRGGNAVYVSTSHIVRVTSEVQSAVAQRALLVWLAARGYPVAPALDATNVDGLDVSLWRRFDTSGLPDPVILGAALRHLHAEAPEEVAAVLDRSLGVMFPSEIDRVRNRLLEPTADSLFEPVGLSACRRALDEIEQTLRTSLTDLVVAHGDFQATNMLGGTDGTWIIDWELVGLAPRWWDLAKISMFAERFDPDGRWRYVVDRFLSEYGDVEQATLRAWTTFALVATTSGCIAKREVRPELGTEAARRLRWWTGASDAPLWQFL